MSQRTASRVGSAISRQVNGPRPDLTKPVVLSSGRTLADRAGRTGRTGRAETQRAPYILLTEVPKPALPTDILRALKEVGAVKSDFPLGSITFPPPSFPRNPSLTKSIHLTASSPSEASEICRTLHHKALFPTSTRSLNLSTYRSSTLSASSSSSSTSSPSDTGIVRAQLIPFTSTQWVENILGRAKELNMERRESMEALSHPISAEWAMRQDLRGRRVVIKGLPGRIDENSVRLIGKNEGLMEGKGTCKRLYPTPWSSVSTWVLTTDSVAAAYALARRVNMNYYYTSSTREPYLMRAEVSW